MREHGFVGCVSCFVGTNRKASSRFLFGALDLRLVDVSSRKLGEYRFSSLAPPIVDACITPGNFKYNI